MAAKQLIMCETLQTKNGLLEVVPTQCSKILTLEDKKNKWQRSYDNLIAMCNVSVQKILKTS